MSNPSLRLRTKTAWCAALCLTLTAGCHRRGETSRTQLRPAEPPAPVATSFPFVNEDLRAELRAMAKADLESEGEFVRPREDGAVHWEDSLRGRNAARLRAIFQEHGWPGNSMVGREGARSAWLIAQHADFDLPFQRECLRLIEAAYYNGDVDGHDLPYLTDRIASAEGRPQMYATQGGHAFTPEQEAVIDARRRGVGLPSLSEFRAMVARGEYQKIHEPGY